MEFTDRLLDFGPILERAADMCFAPALEDRLSLAMDLSAADGVNGNPRLDFEALMTADDDTFLHDIAGIYANLDRETGELGGRFTPRCIE